jgi:hypothetical protein
MKKQLLLIYLCISLSTQANKNNPVITYSDAALAGSLGTAINYSLANCNFRGGVRAYFGIKSAYLGLSTCCALLLHKRNPLKRNKNVSRMYSLGMSAGAGASLSIPLLSEGCFAWIFIVKDKKPKI